MIRRSAVVAGATAAIVPGDGETEGIMGISFAGNPKADYIASLPPNLNPCQTH
jgi:hypothetical protein